MHRASWAAVLTLLASAEGCASIAGGGCDTESLPKDDPCYGKSCCDQVTIGPDGGVVPDGVDAGPGTSTRICGACNG